MAKKKDNALGWLLLIGGGLWLWGRKSYAGSSSSGTGITGQTAIVILPEPADGSAQPSGASDHLEAGLSRGLSWKLWSEPSTEGFREYHWTIRNSRGQLLAHRVQASFTIGDDTDRATSRTHTLERINEGIASLTGG